MNKVSLFFGTGLIVFSILLSGCSGGSLAQADAAKKKMSYKQAGDLYTAAAANIKDKETKQKAREEAAYCYRMANDYEKAIKAYDKVLKGDKKNTDAMYQLGSLKMKIAGDCNADALKEARQHFSDYLAEVPNDERALKKVESIDSAESWKKDIPNSRYKVSNFKVANTKGMDYSPMIASKKDDVLYISSDREGGVAKKKIWGGTGFGYSDLWYLKGTKKGKKKGAAASLTWAKPVLVDGTVNTKFNDGSNTFDRKYSTIYYTQCNGPDGKSWPCKLFQAKLTATQWESEQMLEFCINDTFDYGQPALSDDGKTLYFCSNRDGGEGGYDIWCVTYNQRAKSWGEPFNLGPSINTEKDEMFPYWNGHDASLYFSSKGHLGMGGLDIFRSEGSGTEWTAPENLRAPMNSGGDDFGITFDNNNPDHGFFTSNRCDSKGSFDIYEFTVSPLVIELEGNVYECVPPRKTPDEYNKSKPLAKSTITITNDKDSTKIVVYTDDNGYFGKIRLKEKTNYEITCTNREIYYFDAEPVQITTKGIKTSKVIRQDFCLYSQIIIETVPIYYDLDKANIRPDAAKVLDERILPLLVKYPKLRMELGSHTDCRSSYDYNIDLSQRRADSAVAYLVRKGIDVRRLVAKGYGESQLVNDCKCEGGVKVPCTEEQHQQNRRTVIKTLDVNFDPKVKVADGSDANNTNVKPIIVKLTKKESGYIVPAAGNGVESNGPASVVPGADIMISVNELKALVAKNAITQANLTGMTIADIQSGRIKPGATVKLNTLRFGPKDRANTFTEVTVKVGGTAPYTFGLEALKALNGTFNEAEGEMTFKNVNTEALKGGPVDSKATGGGTTPSGGATAGTTAPAADTVALDDYKRVNLVSQGGSQAIPTMVNDKENVNWVYKASGRKIIIDEATFLKLLESGAVTKKDFEDGESIRLKDGTKLPSNTFIIKKLEIGDVVLENVKVTIDSNATEPEIGGNNTTMKKLNALVKNGILFMKPKEKRSKPGSDE